MTNREIAEKINEKGLLGVGTWCIVTDDIEQALNEAEKRGYDKCRSEAMENGKAIIQEAQKLGAARMRERAAKQSESSEGFVSGLDIANAIRSLPLEAE